MPDCEVYSPRNAGEIVVRQENVIEVSSETDFCNADLLEVHELFELIQELSENEFVLTCTYSAFVSEMPAAELALDMFMT